MPAYGVSTRIHQPLRRDGIDTALVGAVLAPVYNRQIQSSCKRNGEMSGPVHYLTPEGKRDLERELLELTSVRRKEIAEELRRGIEEGDLSENFGYAETRRQQSLVEGRIRELESLLAQSAILEASGDGHAGLGSIVVIREPEQATERYQIVSPAEARPALGRISNESPLGRALLGHRAGDVVEASTPGGKRTIEILSIE